MKLKRFLTFLTSASFETFLFSLTILLLPTQLGRHFWPDFSLVYSLRIDYLSPTIYLWDLLVYGLWVNRGIRRIREIRRGVGIISGLFLVSVIPSIFVSGAYGVGLARLLILVPALLWGMYIASSSGEWVSRQFKRYLPWTIGWVSVLGILQFLKGGTLGLWILGERSFDLSTPAIATFSWYGQVFLRPYATFPHPNVFAAFLIISLLLLIYLNQEKINYFLFSVLIAGSIGVLLSFSRSVALVYLSAVTFLLRRYSLWLLIAGFVLAPLLYVRFESAFNFDQLSLIRREELTETALMLIPRYPWFGVGLNNYIPVAASASFLSGTSRFLQPVHNIFLLSWVESGVLGILGILGLLGSCLWSLSRSLLPFSKRLTLVLIVVFLGMIDHYFLTTPQGLRLLFLIWGISLTKKD